jgi:uncharacterized protein (TIGR03437 family)
MRILAVALVFSWSAWSAAKPVIGPMPVAFEPNRGQDASGADFVAYGDGFALSLRPGRADLIAGKTRLSAVLAGARKPAPGVGESPLPGVVNYFRLDDRSRWITGVPRYGRVRYRAVYPGVDLVYYGNAGKLECDFAVAPGADPSVIRLRYEGARGLHVDAAGDLIVETAGGALRQQRPTVYQEIDGARREIAGNFRIHGKTVTFAVAAYDRRRELVIDPVYLSWSTFVAYSGSPGGSQGEGVASDSSGNVYMIGTTVSTTGDADILISKFSSAGANIFASHVGTQYNDYGHALAVDPAGNIYFAGETSDIPYFESALLGKMDTNGNVLFDYWPDQYSLPNAYGIQGFDYADAVALDASGNFYVAGATTCPYFPYSSGVAQTALAGGWDGFVMKWSSTGAAIYSTFLGGFGSDAINAIAVDSAGNAYVTGSTTSLNFPVTSGAFQPKNNNNAGSNGTAFVTKLSPTLTMVYSTYLGGSGSETGNAIAVDSSGAVYVTGETASTNFPTMGAMQSSFGGGAGDAFLTKLNGNGQTLAYSTYLGGSAEDAGYAIALDASNNAYVTGATASTNFPVTPDAFQASNQGASNAIVADVDPTGGTLLFSSYLGGNGSPGGGGDTGYAVSATCAGGLVVTGATASANFPVTSGAFLGTYPGGSTGANAFLTSIGTGPAVANIGSSNGVLGSWAPAAGPVAPGSLLSIFGSGFAVAQSITQNLPLPASALGTSVTIDNIPAPILYASPSQMNVQVPYEVSPGTAVVTVSNQCGASQPVIFQVAQAAPYVWQNGPGGTAALNQDGTFNAPSNPAAAGSAMVVFVTGIGPVSNPVATGAGAPGSPLSWAKLPYSATIGGWNSAVNFLGLTPGTAGVAQANLIVPALSPGAYAVVVTVGGVASNGPTVYTK